jgi:uncharacterized membrane protein YeiH
MASFFRVHRKLKLGFEVALTVSGTSHFKESIEMYLPSFPNVDLFSAGINALNGVLVARHPSHNRGYAVVGLLILGFFGGIGGGVTRDVLLAEIPSPLKDPAYFFVCLVAGFLGLAIYRYADSKEEQFRTRTLAFFKSFSLPWFAVLGAHKALDHNLGFWAAILIGTAATTAGGVLIDLFSGVTPEIVRPSEHLVTTAIIASSVYTLIAIQMKNSTEFFPVTLIAVGTAFIFRLIAVKEHWKQIVPLDAPAEGPIARA